MCTGGKRKKKGIKDGLKVVNDTFLLSASIWGMKEYRYYEGDRTARQVNFDIIQYIIDILKVCIYTWVSLRVCLCVRVSVRTTVTCEPANNHNRTCFPSKIRSNNAGMW